MFNGIDLAGWKADEEAKKHWHANDGLLQYDGKGEPLRIENEFGDSEFILDFRFPIKGAKSCAVGFFGTKDGELKLSLSPEGAVLLEIKGNSQGTDIPKYARKPIGQWNRLRVSMRNEGYEIQVNGVQVALGKFAPLPIRGAFALRPEGEMEFRNLFVRELKK